MKQLGVTTRPTPPGLMDTLCTQIARPERQEDDRRHRQDRDGHRRQDRRGQGHGGWSRGERGRHARHPVRPHNRRRVEADRRELEGDLAEADRARVGHRRCSRSSGAYALELEPVLERRRSSRRPRGSGLPPRASLPTRSVNSTVATARPKPRTPARTGMERPARGGHTGDRAAAGGARLVDHGALSEVLTARTLETRRVGGPETRPAAPTGRGDSRGRGVVSVAPARDNARRAPARMAGPRDWARNTTMFRSRPEQRPGTPRCRAKRAVAGRTAALPARIHGFGRQPRPDQDPDPYDRCGRPLARARLFAMAGPVDVGQRRR